MGTEAFAMLSHVTHRERLAGADYAVKAVWYELNMQAAHKPDTARAPDGRPVALERGQALTNRTGLARHLRMPVKVVRRCLAELKRRGVVLLKASRLDGTLVTIVGYGAAVIAENGPTERPSEGPTDDGAKPAPTMAFKASRADEGPTERPSEGPPLEELEELRRIKKELHTPCAQARARVIEYDPFPVTEEDGFIADAVRSGIEARARCRLIEGRDFDRAAWADGIRELRREREVTHAEINRVLVAAFRDPLWQRRIDGVATLRKHWVQLALDAQPKLEKRGKPKLRAIEGGYGRDVGAHR